LRLEPKKFECLGFLCNTAVGDTGPTFWVTAEQQTGDDLLAAAQCSVVMAMN
jgi:hypothetical protein